MDTELINIKLKIIEKIVSQIKNLTDFDIEKNKITFNYNVKSVIKIEKAKNRIGIFASDMFLIYINNDFICGIKTDNKFFNDFQSLFEKSEQKSDIEKIKKFNDILDSL